ncbi:MAG: hypothetical protein US52_C0004G0011 [candidate division WS6 bacterium GW2011_GWA2_37_6]|uniref:UvrD-like helicase C-terminal domain-containing protein n=1 Tax=candidate division WS6 bacterium GW2011_GWA2_37_6 TaxID=1619087 RepID=A0A0G0HCI0_9BACT|nr:MAG: hypothetical protein US52_C0004G0011 [candidate division WS6 bacterium GW2011_GWA2_37_6]
MQLSADQKYTIDALSMWYEKLPSQFITVGGYAGTGKTSIIAKFREILFKKIQPKGKKTKLKVAFCSFTGKAARVLESTLQKEKAVYGKDFIGTIHSLIYSPIVDERSKEIIGWEKKKMPGYDLIIIDEASMVDQEIWNDLLSFKIPIVAVGDHGQLPPIRGNFNLMQKPVLKLEQIHRQAAQNPIIKVSILAREQGHIPAMEYSKKVRKLDRGDEETGSFIEELLQGFNDEMLVLCGYNTTRVKLNKYIRSLLEITSPSPQVNDRVICLRNNHEKQIFNGMLGKIKYIEDDSEGLYYAEIEELNNGNTFKGLISKEQFNADKGLNFTSKRGKTVHADLFDFGYALTVHKAQGSQAQKVVLFEERFKQMNDEDWRRWLYTGVTRAEEELYVVG